MWIEELNATALCAERHDLWRVVDYEVEVLESLVANTRDKKAALKILKTAMRKHGRSETIITDLLRPYGADLKGLGAEALQETGS